MPPKISKNKKGFKDLCDLHPDRSLKRLPLTKRISPMGHWQPPFQLLPKTQPYPFFSDSLAQSYLLLIVLLDCLLPTHNKKRPDRFKRLQKVWDYHNSTILAALNLPSCSTKGVDFISGSKWIRGPKESCQRRGGENKPIPTREAQKNKSTMWHIQSQFFFDHQ